MLHYIALFFLVYIVVLLAFPQAAVAATLILLASITNLVGKIDWTLVPF